MPLCERLLLLACAAAASHACGGSPGQPSSAPPNQDTAVPCAGTISGRFDLNDAGFSCVVVVATLLDGGYASFELANAGALPLPTIGLGAVVGLPSLQAGGSLDAGADGGTADAGSFAVPGQASGSAVVQLGDGESFALQGSTAQGAARLTFSYVSDAGVLAGGARVYPAHGSFDATLPFALGVLPDAGIDGGPFDAGAVLFLHATF